jgi:putative peptidoglycan lipid II flippase
MVTAPDFRLLTFDFQLILMPSKPQMLRSSLVVGFFFLLGGLTGILVETSIAAKLGLSRSSDTFYVAFTVPYIITTLLAATGQFSLVPFFARLDAGHSIEELWKGFSYCVNVLLLGLGTLAALGAAASPWVVRGIAPGFTRPQTELATQLCQWLFLIIIPAGVVEVFRSFLLSQHRFALPSATGFLRNTTVIVVILVSFNRYGSYSMVLGYMAGYLLQLLVLGAQVLASFRPRYSLTLVARGEAFRNLRGAGSAQLGAALAFQGVVIIERIIASFLPAGTLTALNYGFKILGTLAELLGGSVGTAALPALSRAAARTAEKEGRETFQNALEISLILVSPAVVFCLMLDRSIIRLVFERGSFTPAATGLMAAVFFYYSLSLLPFAFIRLLAFALFARHEPGAFLRLSALQYGLTVGFDLFYVGVLRLGAKGIPLGMLTGLVLASALAIQRNLGDLRQTMDRTLGLFAAKNLLGGLLAALTVWVLRLWVQPPLTGFQDLVYLCELCGAGSVVYLAALAALRAFPARLLAALWSGASES